MRLSAYVKLERGRVAALSARLQVSGSLVTQWAGGKPVPPARAVEIEHATGGAVKRCDLRPDDWHRIWPELVTAQHPAPEAEVRHAA